MKKFKKRTHEGVFIVVEGPDGSGKGVQTRSLARWLKKKYPSRHVLLTHEPWEGEFFGRMIRKVLKGLITEIDSGDGKIIAKKFQYWYVKNRIQHQIRLIKKVLVGGGIVVCDRERLSTYVYGYIYGLPIELVKLWHDEEVELTPDVIIYLDTDVETCIKRIVARDEEIEFFDRPDKVHRAVSAYRYIIANECIGIPIITIDNERSKVAVRTDVRNHALSIIEQVDNVA